MISERYTRWVAMLAQSDANLVRLAVIALALVVAWRAAPLLPAPWAARLRLLEMLGSLIVVAEVITGVQPSPMWLVLGGLVLALMLAGLRLVSQVHP